MQIKTTLSVLGAASVMLLTACSKENNFETTSSKIAGNKGTTSKLPTSGTTAKTTSNFSSVIDGNVVTFQPASVGPSLCYTWDFGDTTANSALKSPIHTYSPITSSPYEQAHDVTLKVSNSATGEFIAPVKQTIYTFYKPSFSESVYEFLGEDGFVRYELSLTNSTPEGIYSSYEWHSGNGETSYTENPVFYYFRSEDAFPYDYFPYVILTNAATGRKHIQYYHYRF